MIGLAGVALCVAACGARSELPGDRDDIGGLGAAGAGGSEPAPPSCNFDAARTTLPGPCAAAGLECGAMCGDCPGELSCFQGRCYAPIGPGADFDFGPDHLMRGLRDTPEGESCFVEAGGSLEAVEAAIWNNGIETIVMEVSVSCEDTMALVRTVPLPASLLPAYDGIHSEVRSTVFPVEPPVMLREGDTVDVRFYTPDSSSFATGGVSGIERANIDSQCRFVPDDADGVSPGTAKGWDYRVRLYVH